MVPAGNVLIVEDDADTREMLAALLSMQGFHAVGAEDGLEALHLLRTVRHRAPDVPCLVLLDLTMPSQNVSFTLSAWSAVAGGAIGIAAGIVAALMPAWRACAQPPARALRGAA